MSTEPGRKRGRPVKRLLSRDKIVTEALRIMDSGESDENGVSLSQIAANFGVQVSALYNHVQNKSDLYQGIREALGAQVNMGCFEEEPWDAALATWIRSYHGVIAAHPPTVALIAALPASFGSIVYVIYDAAVAGLGRAGWPLDEALAAVWSVEALLLGSVNEMKQTLDPQGAKHTHDYADGYAEWHVRATGTGGSVDAQWFNTSLEFLLRGLRARHAEIVADRQVGASLS